MFSGISLHQFQSVFFPFSSHRSAQFLLLYFGVILKVLLLWLRQNIQQPLDRWDAIEVSVGTILFCWGTKIFPGNLLGHENLGENVNGVWIFLTKLLVSFHPPPPPSLPGIINDRMRWMWAAIDNGLFSSFWKYLANFHRDRRQYWL